MIFKIGAGTMLIAIIILSVLLYRSGKKRRIAEAELLEYTKELPAEV